MQQAQQFGTGVSGAADDSDLDHRNLRETPGRSARARELLLQTAKPILDVAVACGFASASHFSRCYRAVYGHKPSDERAAALAGRARQPGR